MVGIGLCNEPHWSEMKPIKRFLDDALHAFFADPQLQGHKAYVNLVGNYATLDDLCSWLNAFVERTQVDRLRLVADYHNYYAWNTISTVDQLVVQIYSDVQTSILATAAR